MTVKYVEMTVSIKAKYINACYDSIAPIFSVAYSKKIYRNGRMTVISYITQASVVVRKTVRKRHVCNQTKNFEKYLSSRFGLGVEQTTHVREDLGSITT